MHERTNIQLSRADRSKLEAVVANRNSPQKHAWRAKIVLLTADGRGTAEIMQATGKAKTVIWRWQERFRDEGAAGLWRDKTRRSSIPPLRPEVAKRVVALTLAGPPPAASHWTGSAMAKAAGISVSSRNNYTTKAINYCLSRWDAFTRFLDDGRLCMSNNAAERELRAVAVGRRNWTFAGSDEGGRRAATIYTLIATAKLNDIDPQAWLADVLARLPDHPAKRIHELLPWNWRPQNITAQAA